MFVAYQHPVSAGVEMQIAEAIIKAGDHLRIKGKLLKDCIDDMDAYLHLHDGVFYKVCLNFLFLVANARIFYLNNKVNVQNSHS